MYEHALVLSGGGANGAYENGVIQGLAEAHERGEYSEPDLVVGTSVGALNGSKLCEHPIGNFYDAAMAVNEEWERLRGNKDIYKPHFLGMIPSALLLALKCKMSIHNTKPLQKHVRANLDPAKLALSGRMFACNAVELGGSAGSRWFDSFDPDIVEGVLASSSFPVFFEPIKIDGKVYSDGGLRDQTPISKAISMGARRIDVVSCDHGKMSRLRSAPKGVDMIGRILKVLLDEIDTDDFLKATLINELVKADAPIAKRKGWRFVEMNLIRPDTGLGESLDFSPEKNRRLRERGLDDARQFLRFVN